MKKALFTLVLLVAAASLLAACAAPIADEPTPEAGETKYASLEGDVEANCDCIAGEKPGDKYVLLPEGTAAWSELIEAAEPEQGIVANTAQAPSGVRVSLESVYSGTWRTWQERMETDGWTPADAAAYDGSAFETLTGETVHYTGDGAAVQGVYDPDERTLVITRVG